MQMPFEAHVTGADRRKRMPRRLITAEESDQVFADMQGKFVDSQTQFEDMNFIKDASDQVRWMRFEAQIEESDRKHISAVFSAPIVQDRRQMRFACPGHGDSPCRVSAAANCLLEFPSLLARILPQPGSESSFNLMRFRLWSFGHWEDVYVDDLLPFEPEGSQVILEVRNDESEDFVKEVSISRLYYMKPEEPQSGHELEVWPFFLEKAVAKLIGSYHLLKAMTFDRVISMLMGCDVLSKRIVDSYDSQLTTLLQILTVMQRNSIVLLRQEVPSKLRGCQADCMLHKTADVYVVLAFKETTDVLKLSNPVPDTVNKNVKFAVSSLQVLKSVQLLVRRVSCNHLPSWNRCQATPTDDSEADLYSRDLSRKNPKAPIDMSQDQLFTEKGVFWETAAYLMGHFSHAEMCLFPGDSAPPTAREDLISLSLLPWHTGCAVGAWVRGKNSISNGSRRQMASFCPHYVLNLRCPTDPQQPILTALMLRQSPNCWQRANRVPIRLQLYFIGEQLLNEFNRRDVYELKNREQLERQLEVSGQLSHRSVFTTGSVSELLTLRHGSFLVLAEVGIPGDEADYMLTAYCSSACELLPFHNVFDVGHESGASRPEAGGIRCRELRSCPVRTERDAV